MNMEEALLLSANSFNKRLASHMTEDMKLIDREDLPGSPDHHMRSHCRNYYYIGSHQISPIIGNNDPLQTNTGRKKGIQNEIQQSRCSIEAMQLEYQRYSFLFIF